ALQNQVKRTGWYIAKNKNPPLWRRTFYAVGFGYLCYCVAQVKTKSQKRRIPESDLFKDG
ncbi:MAG TPA: hypothetical protein VIM79_16290, partial [Niastella sp.]